MKFSIDFDVENAFFDRESFIERNEAIAEIIDNVAEKVRNGAREGLIADPNGNVIGKFNYGLRND